MVAEGSLSSTEVDLGSAEGIGRWSVDLDLGSADEMGRWR